MKSADARPPVPVDHTAREGLIRDLYAIAAFYVANPDHPLPDLVTLSHRTDIATVREIALRFHPTQRVYGPTPQTHHDLPGTSVAVNFVVNAPGATQ